ncbi:tumor necrosis factor receptor superfamily member 6B-like [Leucoraja erinacea]|uniref:tumor necrosis factor receptor superfamily member 6B-like n=1 Tax=Leucoraja erinaceus TaxID=7782 RepID=UPI002458D50F|nr:tumor necrosis factor receptor superfamily member 6B-like [Leucoraja erinacea]
MILKCLVVFVLSETVSSGPGIDFNTLWTTFVRAIPKSNQKVRCKMCPPGKYVAAPCISGQATTCADCLKGQYNPYWSSLEKCHDCKLCGENEDTVSECNHRSNTGCRCNVESFINNGHCKRLTTCFPGYGVLTPGTYTSDSTCEECPRGHFSSTISSKDVCLPHTICADGLVVNVPGNTQHDTLCTPCNKYDNSTACDDALLHFVGHQNIPEDKLEAFARLLAPPQSFEALYWKLTRPEHRNNLFTYLDQYLMNWKTIIDGQPVAETIISILEKAKLNNVLAKVLSRFW